MKARLVELLINSKRLDEARVVSQELLKSNPTDPSAMALDGRIDVAPFISRTLPLDEVNRAFELLEAQDGIRSVIRFG